MKKFGIKDFIKEFILEQDDDVIVISPDDYLQLVFDVGGIASRIPLLKEYRNKKIVINGSLNVKDNKKIGELSGVIRIKGRLDISNSNVPTLDGITVDGYVSKYGSTLWENEQKKRLRELLDDQEERRSENAWDIRNGEDESERTEAFYLYLNEIGIPEEGEDKYNIVPQGKGSYGYGKSYEWVNGSQYFGESVDVYTEDEIELAAKESVKALIDDIGISSFGNEMYLNHIDTEEWGKFLENLYEDMIYSDPEGFDIPLEFSKEQNEKIKKIREKISLISDKMRKEDVGEEKFNEFEQTIDHLNELIDYEYENPKGDDYDQDLIDNEVKTRVEYYIDDIKHFVDDYGYNKDFIKDFVDMDSFIQEIVDQDGYGHALNSYDGNVEEYKINGTWYYVVRTN